MDIRNVLLIILLVVLLYVIVISYGGSSKSYNDSVSGSEEVMLEENVDEGYDYDNNGVEGFAMSNGKRAQVLRDHTDSYGSHDAMHNNVAINGDYKLDGKYEQCITPVNSSGVIRPYGCEGEMNMNYGVDGSNGNSVVTKKGVVDRDEFVYPYSDRIHEPLDMVVDTSVPLEYSILNPHMKTYNQINTKEGDYRYKGMPSGDLDFEDVSDVIESENEKRLKAIRNGFEFSENNPAKDPEMMY